MKSIRFTKAELKSLALCIGNGYGDGDFEDWLGHRKRDVQALRRAMWKLYSVYPCTALRPLGNAGNRKHSMTEPISDPEFDWLSGCCGMPPIGPVFERTHLGPGGQAVPLESGVCSKCRDSTNFTRQETKTTTKG